MLNFIAIDNRYSRLLQSHFLVHSMYEIFKIVTRVSKLTFSTKLPTFDSFYLLDYTFTIMELDRTYHPHHFIFSFTF